MFQNVSNFFTMSLEEDSYKEINFEGYNIDSRLNFVVSKEDHLNEDTFFQDYKNFIQSFNFQRETECYYFIQKCIDLINNYGRKAAVLVIDSGLVDFVNSSFIEFNVNIQQQFMDLYSLLSGIDKYCCSKVVTDNSIQFFIDIIKFNNVSFLFCNTLKIITNAAKYNIEPVFNPELLECLRTSHSSLFRRKIPRNTPTTSFDNIPTGSQLHLSTYYIICFSQFILSDSEVHGYKNYFIDFILNEINNPVNEIRNYVVQAICSLSIRHPKQTARDIIHCRGFLKKLFQNIIDGNFDDGGMLEHIATFLKPLTYYANQIDDNKGRKLSYERNNIQRMEAKGLLQVVEYYITNGYICEDIIYVIAYIIRGGEEYAHFFVSKNIINEIFSLMFNDEQSSLIKGAIAVLFGWLIVRIPNHVIKDVIPSPDIISKVVDVIGDLTSNSIMIIIHALIILLEYEDTNCDTHVILTESRIFEDPYDSDWPENEKLTLCLESINQLLYDT